ncbi:MAG: 4'-phosphopantetheinyl transferase superfamily protein [Pseudomonadota bacterium]
MNKKKKHMQPVRYNRGVDKMPLFVFQQASRKKFFLNREDVHLWPMNYGHINHADVWRLSELLSAAERSRAERYRFADDQKHFIIRHGLLRILLGNYLNVEPSELQIKYNENGKPFSTANQENGTIQFNLSHSKEMIFYAFTCGRNIGVDIEFIQPMTSMDAVVEGFFSESEKAEYNRLPKDRRTEGFYNCWTRKEAFLKAIGEGLSRGLDTFDISLIPGETAELKRVDWNVQKAGQWGVKSITSIPGYAAAIAVEGSDWTMVEVGGAVQEEGLTQIAKAHSGKTVFPA